MTEDPAFQKNEGHILVANFPSPLLQIVFKSGVCLADEAFHPTFRAADDMS